MRASVVAAALVLAMPEAARAQGLVELSFRARAGSRIQTILDTRLSTIVVGFPSMPDSTVIESSWRTVTTQNVVEARGTSRLVSATLDSSRARAKVGTGARDEVAMPGAQGLSGRWAASQRLMLTAISGQGGDSAFIDALTSLAGGLRLLLPEAALPVGGEWSGPFSFPLGAHLTAGGRIVTSGSIGGVATAVLDSVLPRGTDTLAYITVRAVTSPTTVRVAAEGGVGTGTFIGGFAAALVWSSGWNAVVSGATNGRVTGTVSLQRPDGPVVNGALTLTIAGRQQMRL